MSEHTIQNRSFKHHKGKRSWMRKLFSFILALFVVSIVGMAAFLLYLRTQSLPTSQIIQTSQILDSHGQVVDSFYSGQNRQIVSIDDISPDFAHAVVSVEDKRFYNHFGIDLYGTARAVWVDIQHMAKVQGASTITQQLARNLYLSQDRTWNRKIKEAVYAIQLEMNYGKDDILEMYMNNIYFGHSLYGVQTAAKTYFGVSAKDLTLAQSALLAGVPKGPYYYSPYYNMENAKSRQQIVLQAMVDEGWITQSQADAAYAEELNYLPLENQRMSEAPYFSDYIRKMAVEKLGITDDQLDVGGLRIYTTLDLRMQKIAEEVVSKNMKDRGELQAALVAIDPRTGYVKAMVGGKDYNENQYNRVFATTRQPGSSFKPIMYLTALQQEGFSAVTQYRSAPTVFTYDEGRKTYAPGNYAEKYPYEDIMLREAIAKSDNIYAVHTIMDIGADNVIEMARKLGISSQLSPLPSLALGTFPVSPFEMASAFGTIANQGERVEPVAILRIEDTTGHILYESSQQREQVVDPAYTYVLTQLMGSVFEPGGTGSSVSSTIKRPVAGKTGTTDTDAWMVGFTPELSAAVWVGYDRDRGVTPVEAHLPSPIFASFIEQALEPVPPKLFPIPQGVVSLYIDSESGKIATPQCGGESQLEYFVKGTEPTEFCSGGVAEEEAPIPGQEDEGQKAERRSWWEDLKRWWWNE